jgi:predicted ATP-dependent serine protease
MKSDVPPKVLEGGASQKTGIDELDQMLRGGFLEGDAVMIEGSAGAGKTTLALEHIVNA